MAVTGYPVTALYGALLALVLPALSLLVIRQRVRNRAALGTDGGEALLRAARGADKQLIADAALFDRYAGERLPEGKVSLALQVTLQPREATLTDAEIEAVAERIVAAVAKATGATLRG